MIRSLTKLPLLTLLRLLGVVTGAVMATGTVALAARWG
jgi:hypothetical protein